MKKTLSQWFLNRGGWTLSGERPTHRRFVLIAAPHTSNWDFPYMLAYASICDIQVNWLAKHSLFNPPFGTIMRALGGIPIVRHKNSNVVSDMIGAFSDNEDLALVVPTEGTRSLTEYWKSGFYHIAKGAGVPIIPSFLDFERREGGFGPALFPGDDIRKDMDYFRSFYADKLGKFPAKFGPIRLREEDRGD